ncbi:MAG TPA: tetratricopeptide repeat protein [Thermoanaerobaculia bacterium]|nr:tetratricopeptide repeat protein [Thermoanaerobaculia bacterium]
MKRAFMTSSLFIATLLMITAGCSSGRGDLSNASTQRRFGVRMAKMNLWREARFRFQRATQIEPQNAMAHNNLAVAYEATGDFDAAAREYREALRLDRSNQYIQKNYSRFVEFTQKAKKRQQTPAVPAAKAAAGAATTAQPATATAAQPPAQSPAPQPPATTTNPPEEGH